MARKVKFKCLCSHEEEIHNFDPDSAFFGCCAKFYKYSTEDPDEGYDMDEVHCGCDEYRPDNLRYIEDHERIKDGPSVRRRSK